MLLKISLFKSTYSDSMSPQRKYLASNANLFIDRECTYQKDTNIWVYVIITFPTINE